MESVLRLVNVTVCDGSVISPIAVIVEIPSLNELKSISEPSCPTIPEMILDTSDTA